MRRKREERGKAADSAAIRWDLALLAAATCLLVVTPLIPSESAVKDGTAAPLVILWLLALVGWAVWLVVDPRRQVLGGWTLVAAAVLVALHTVSALAAGMHGNARQALNVLWLFVAYGVAIFLLRQLLQTRLACRALVAVMIALAAAESASGHYEYFVSGPARRAAFQQDPESFYRQQGASARSEREHLRWRIESVEPIGTFALTNSLAGLLAPWLLALGGIALAILEDKNLRRRAAGAAAIAAVIAGCLLLTKSRTALLAAAGGAVLLLIYGRERSWRLDWKIPTLAGAVAVLLGLIAVAVGGLDAKVLSQAPQSVLYRLEYWRSTAAMIADYPLLGCGPGNFQEHYARYQLPQASETVSDPHNFLLEIWATAGTPALLALLATAAAFIWELSRASRSQTDAPSAESAASDAASRRWIYGGALAGFLLAYPLGLVANYPLEMLTLGGLPLMPVMWLIGLPAAGLTVWLLDGWVLRGRMPAAVPLVALIVLLTNLLAAGAVMFPGVFGSICLLIPLSLAHAEAPAWRWSPPRPAALAAALSAALLLVACMFTAYQPVLSGSVQVEEGQRLYSSGQWDAAEQSFQAAATTDPWSPQPWQALADLSLQIWLRSQAADDWDKFQQAAGEFLRRDSRHFRAQETLGNWYFVAWRASERPNHLAAAIHAYQQAIAWRPNRALLHAQLAWLLHLAQRKDDALAEAETALRLDRLNPHAEHKLAKQTIFDPPAGGLGSQPLYRPEHAEQTMKELRSSALDK